MERSGKNQSIFDHRSLLDIGKEIQDVYLADQRPWVIGYSGGKDSTTALQLIWHALADLPKEKLNKPVYVIASDTLVETPVIVDYIETTLRRLNEAAQKTGLPFQAHKVQPQLTDTFWVNLVGRGYPAPNNHFRWCTDRMKIQPANRFILERITEHGEVIVILGVRKAESVTRAQVMNLHRMKNSPLSRHSRLPKAWVYTPIEDFSVEDVWSYLLQVPSPWGNNNRDLVAIYKNANAGECPLVIDDTTPSCGNSRFGCWVCTVVTKDKSMEAMIDNGEEWMEPLLEFRDWLASTQDVEVKPIYRTFKRRDGHTRKKRDGSLMPGPYKFEVCKDMLRRLLKIQEDVRKNGTDPEFSVISDDELHEIRRLWRNERQDWEDSLPAIYREVMDQDLEWLRDDLGTFTSKENCLLNEVCIQEGVTAKMVMKLLDVERQLQGMSRRSSIYSQIDRTLKEEWRSDEEIVAEALRENGNGSNPS